MADNPHNRENPAKPIVVHPGGSHASTGPFHLPGATIQPLIDPVTGALIQPATPAVNPAAPAAPQPTPTPAPAPAPAPQPAPAPAPAPTGVAPKPPGTGTPTK